MIDPNWQPKPLFALGNQQVAYQAPTFAGKKPSFLESLLPSLGGLGGGIGGGALGGAIAGSAILPGIGTAAGGLLGALLGGALGGGAGKVAENKLTGESTFHDVPKEAAIQGALSAGPLRLLKGVGAGGEALLAGGDALAGDVGEQGTGRLVNALNAAGEKAASPSFIKTAIANKFGGASDNLAQRALKINDSKFATDFANRSGEELGSFANRFKLPGMAVADARANIVSPASELYGKAIDSIGNIPKSDIMTAVQSEANKFLSSKIPSQQAIGQSILEHGNGILDNFEGNAVHASDLNGVKSELYGLVNPKLMDSAGTQSNQAYDSVANALRKTINGAAQSTGAPLDTEALAKLGFKSDNVGDLGHELFNLNKLLDKADVKSRVGAGKSLFSLGTLPGITGGGLLGGPAGAIGGGLASAAVNSGAGTRAIAQGAEALAGRAEKSALSSAAPYAAGNIAKRVLPVGLIGALSGQASNASSNTNPTNQTSIMNSVPNNDIGSLSADTSGFAIPGNTQPVDNQDPTADPSSPFNPANVEGNIRQIVANGGKMTDVQNYVSLVGALQSLNQKSQQPQQLTASQQKSADNIQNAQSLLDAADAQVAELGGVQGPRGAATHIPVLGQYINPKAAAYNATKVDIASALAQALTGSARNTALIRSFEQSLPNIEDRPEVAQQKLDNLRLELQKRAVGLGIAQ